MPNLRSSIRSKYAVGALVVTGVAAVVFWRTAYPTITWWDSGQYSLAARTLGVTGPPGSLLLTLLGWPFAHLPLGGSPAYVLNLLAGALAAFTVGLVYVCALRLAGIQRPAANTAAMIGAAAGALTFAFSDTLWEHAVKFTPYVLSAVFTGLILWTLLRWWDEAEHPESWRLLALLALLFGLDFSVHRTNALLIPGAVVWILLRDPGVFRRSRTVLNAGAAFVAGLSVQLLVIPMAAFTRSPLSYNNPTDWHRFWDYISLKNLGGGFLLGLLPRKSPFWSGQVADLLHVLRDNFFHIKSPGTLLGALPAAAALFGVVILWKRNRRLGAAFAALLFLQAAGTVIYFNIPADFFRPFDRHYLPVCVTIAVLIAYGSGALFEWAATPALRLRVVAVAGSVLATLAPAGQLTSNWALRDASNIYFTRDYAANALGQLPPNAIYFTVGDNDTFPVMYLQAAEGVRPDVRIVNISIASMQDFAAERLRLDPAFPLSMTSEQRLALSTPLARDSLVLPVAGNSEDAGLARHLEMPSAVTFHVRPRDGKQMLPDELILYDIVRTNRWLDPLCFAITGSSSVMSWLEPYGRLDGMYWRIVPMAHVPPDPAILRANLMSGEYRGFDNPSVRVDFETMSIAFQYYSAFTELLRAEKAHGAADRCRQTLRWLFDAVPPERFNIPGLREKTEGVC